MTMLTMKQVAERLNMSRTGVYALRKLKHDPLVAVPTGARGGYRVDESDLDAWIKRRKVAA